MAPRTYQQNKRVPPTPLRRYSEPAEIQPWEDGRLLHDLKEAVPILTTLLGSGYSYKKLRSRIANGTWQQGRHWWKTDGRYKVNIKAIIDWQKECL